MSAGHDTGTGEVAVGFLSFTEVTDPGAHRAYNAWHQLDHLPEQLPLPGVVWGQRWVSTPACTAARAAQVPPLDRTHYVTLYLMAEPVEEVLEGFFALARSLRAAGRFFDARQAHLTGPYEVVEAAAAPRVLVSAAAVPFRPTRGIYVVVEPTGNPGAPGAGDLVAVPGVAGAWVFEDRGRFDATPWQPGHDRVTICFLDEPPLAVAPSLAPLAAPAATARAGSQSRGGTGTHPGTGERAGSGPGPLFAGALETVVPWEWDWFETQRPPAGPGS